MEADGRRGRGSATDGGLGCGLVEGDELMWINHTECTGSVDQCVEALKGADAGELTVIARRKKREVDVEVKVGP